MKKIIILSISLFFLTIYGLNAQKDLSPSYVYRFFNEYGFFTGSTWENSEYGIINEGEFGITGIFVNGVQIGKTHFLGLGLGYEGGVTIGQGIPIFLNYRYFFDKGYKVKPYMHLSMGTRYAFWDEERYYEEVNEFGYDVYISDPIARSGMGIYSSLGVGFTAHAFSFSTSIFYRSRPGENLKGIKSFTGVEVKAGFTL